MRVWSAAGVAVIAASLGGSAESGLPVLLSSPSLNTGEISFACPSAPDQLITLQTSDSVSESWNDLSYHPGTGQPVAFSAALTARQRFFRLRLTPLQVFDLSPSEPALATRAVSLPDAVVGAAYAEEIGMALTGVPPHTFQLEGFPPEEVRLVAD